MYVNPSIDLIGMRAFTKLKVRKSLDGGRFSHWLPLYFGENEKYTIETQNWSHEEEQMVKKIDNIDTLERFEKHFMNTINFVTNGSTRQPVTSEQALKFMTKLIGTHIIDLMKENRHVSILAIRRLFNFIRLLLFLMQKDGNIEKDLDSQLGSFMTDAKCRHKDVCKALLDYQVLALVSNKVNKAEFMQLYCDE